MICILEIDKYQLKDSGMGSGTFLKIHSPYKIISGELFSIGKDLNFIIALDRHPSVQDNAANKLPS